jgi:acetoacetyl-CoA reductase
MAKKVQDELGVVDILVNNAAARAKVTPRCPFQQTTEEGWHAAVALNLDSLYYCCRTFIGGMIDKRYGKIINISSIDGVVGGIGDIDYTTIKAGYIGFTVSLAKEVASYGINVNAISPGPILTPALANSVGARPGGGGMLDMMAEWAGVGRMGKPEEIGYTVAFLASDEAAFITGQNIPVCGLANWGGVRYSKRY